MAQASGASSTRHLCVPAVDTDSVNCHRMALWRECREACAWCQQKCGMSCSLSDQGPLLFRERGITFHPSEPESA
jgi:hypothetical protein